MNRSGDKKGNITASFGSDIIYEGITGIPNLLLKYYSRLGITDSEMMLIIQLIWIQTSTNQKFPSVDYLIQYMSEDRAQIKAHLASLIEKGAISINHIYCEETVEIIPCYSYEPLCEKVSEMWACEKVKACQMMKKVLKEQKQPSDTVKNKDRQPVFAKACQVFEKEFGRLLSPMEIEQINLWLDDNGTMPDLILEALKRAVMLGKHNFKYIDSILLEWQKNRLKNVAEVLAYEANFRERQITKPAKKRSEVSDKKKDKFRLLYLS
jgi:DNA replication protein